MEKFIMEFNKYTKEAEKVANTKIKRTNFLHWIDAAKELNKIVNRIQEEYIESLNMTKIKTVSGSTIYINLDSNIIIYGCSGNGRYTIGYLYNGIIAGNEEKITTVSGVRDLEPIDKSYMMPTFLRKDFIEDNKNKSVINRIFE